MAEHRIRICTHCGWTLPYGVSEETARRLEAEHRDQTGHAVVPVRDGTRKVERDDA